MRLTRQSEIAIGARKRDCMMIVEAASVSFVGLMDRFTIADLTASIRPRPKPMFPKPHAAHQAATVLRERPDSERPLRHAM